MGLLLDLVALLRDGNDVLAKRLQLSMEILLAAFLVRPRRRWLQRRPQQLRRWRWRVVWRQNRGRRGRGHGRRGKALPGQRWRGRRRGSRHGRLFWARRAERGLD